jgi:hypothetical protein
MLSTLRLYSGSQCVLIESAILSELRLRDIPDSDGIVIGEARVHAGWALFVTLPDGRTWRAITVGPDPNLNPADSRFMAEIASPLAEFSNWLVYVCKARNPANIAGRDAKPLTDLDNAG